MKECYLNSVLLKDRESLFKLFLVNQLKPLFFFIIFFPTLMVAPKS